MMRDIIPVAMAAQKADMGAKDERNLKCVQQLEQGTPKAFERRLECREKRMNGIKQFAVNHDDANMKYLTEGR